MDIKDCIIYEKTIPAHPAVYDDFPENLLPELAGYNDLATTDAHLLSEWDYEKNKNISPNKISRHSMQSVWWKCSLGHSWKAKISERAIEGKGCKVCEKDYLTVFPKLAVMYYAAKKRIKVQTDTDKIIGIPLEIYLPEEKAAIETVSRTDRVFFYKLLQM